MFEFLELSPQNEEPKYSMPTPPSASPLLHLDGDEEIQKGRMLVESCVYN